MNKTCRAYFWIKGLVFSGITVLPVATLTILQHNFVNAVHQPLSPLVVTTTLSNLITSSRVVITQVCKYLV